MYSTAGDAQHSAHESSTRHLQQAERIQNPSRGSRAALALAGPCLLPSTMPDHQASPAQRLISPSLRGICASSRSPNEACTQAALYSAASRCSRVGAVPSACSHRRRAPMRSPPSYLARPALSSCSACDVQDGRGAGGVWQGQRSGQQRTWSDNNWSQRMHAQYTTPTALTSADARHGTSWRRRAAGGMQGRVKRMHAASVPSRQRRRQVRAVPRSAARRCAFISPPALTCHKRWRGESRSTTQRRCTAPGRSAGESRAHGGGAGRRLEIVRKAPMWPNGCALPASPPPRSRCGPAAASAELSCKCSVSVMTAAGHATLHPPVSRIDTRHQRPCFLQRTHKQSLK